MKNITSLLNRCLNEIGDNDQYSEVRYLIVAAMSKLADKSKSQSGFKALQEAIDKSYQKKKDFDEKIKENIRKAMLETKKDA